MRFVGIFLAFLFMSNQLSGNVLKFHTKDGLLNKFTRYYLMDREKRLWVATFGNGIRVFNGKTWKVYTTGSTKDTRYNKQGLLNDHILAMAMDYTNSYLWVITTDGLCRMNLKTEGWEHFNGDKKPPVDFVRDVAVDDNGNAFFATYAGVAEYTIAGKWKMHTVKDGLYDENIRLVRFAEGSIWAGSRAGAVCRLDGKRWVTYIDY
ncbi:hypothetical protein ACFL35_06870 [Candidatus Riflebacteria bacterium]